MRVIVCHNFYQQNGGEDQVFADECDLLRSRGHEVRTFIRHNDSVKDQSRLRLAVGTIWNREAVRSLTAEVRQFQADVVHFHNTIPLISPAAFRAASHAGAAVVMSLHNYRLMCPSATFYRDGKTCESCMGRVPLPAVLHGCYRNSRAASAALATMLVTHRLIGTFSQHIHAYIALCEFARQKHIQAGIPRDRLELKPNFLTTDPGIGKGDGGYMMYLGRLVEDKGLKILLDSWIKHAPSMQLRVIGRGPLADHVREASRQNPNIVFHDNETMDGILRLLGGAAALILPSINYEGFPKVIVESFSRGTPVLASKLGAMEEIVVPGVSGLHFQPGDGEALMRCVKSCIANPSLLASMRATTRQQFESKYTPDVNYKIFMEIYQRAIARRHGIQESQIESIDGAEQMNVDELVERVPEGVLGRIGCEP